MVQIKQQLIHMLTQGKNWKDDQSVPETHEEQDLDAYRSISAGRLWVSVAV